MVTITFIDRQGNLHERCCKWEDSDRLVSRCERAGLEYYDEKPSEEE